MKWKIALTISEMNRKKKKMENKSTIKPYRLKKIFRESKLEGSKENRICEPSKGGTGSRLNTPKRILMYAIYPKSKARIGFRSAPKNLKTRPNAKATNRLEAGPAKLTLALPHFWSRRLNGFTGTGFAQPKIMPAPVICDITAKNKGKATDPMGSIWGKGLRVNRPAFFAVGSPKEFAIQPWDTSCRTTEKIKIPIWNTKNSIPSLYHNSCKS